LSIDKVRAYLRSRGMDNRILEFEDSSATVELAAHAVGCEPARIAKTLSFDLAGDPIVVVTAGDMRIREGSSRQHSMASPRCWQQKMWRSAQATLWEVYVLLP